MDDDHAVAREVDVELETVRAQTEPVVEGGDRVLGTERRTAAVRVDEWKRHGDILVRGNGTDGRVVVSRLSALCLRSKTATAASGRAPLSV